MEQEEINTLAPQIQKIVSAGMSALSFTPEEIVFPYRQEYPSQELLNCIGQYPSIDTSVYNQCIQGKVYNTGDMCYENNMLLEQSGGLVTLLIIVRTLGNYIYPALTGLCHIVKMSSMAILQLRLYMIKEIYKCLVCK